ncbi:MAG: hypothetical protein KC589_09820 [Nanoarchaeota archaeon]|nr:hypothetical protein [Nanoarchaeota archaeon]
MSRGLTIPKIISNPIPQYQERLAFLLATPKKNFYIEREINKLQLMIHSLEEKIETRENINVVMSDE